MNTRKLAGIFDAARMEKMLGQLPAEAQYALFQFGGRPDQWASAINAALMRPNGKPAHFEKLPPSVQMQWAFQQIIKPDSPLASSGLVDRLTQLSAAAAESNRQDTMSPQQKIRSLIEETTAQKAADRGDGITANDLATTSLDAKTLDHLTMDQKR